MCREVYNGLCACEGWQGRCRVRVWRGARREGKNGGAQLGKKGGKYLLILFKMQGTDAVAISGVSWKIGKIPAALAL